MFFISVIGNRTSLLTHFFHDGLFGRLRCDTAKLSRSFFKFDFISQFISRADGKSIFQANFQSAIKYFIHYFTNSINAEVTSLFIKLDSRTFCLTISSPVSRTQRFCNSFNDIFFFDSFVFFQDAESIKHFFTHSFLALRLLRAFLSFLL